MGPAGPMGPPVDFPAEQFGIEIHFQAPPEWRQGDLESSRMGIRIRRDAAFLVGQNERQAEITITSLPTSPGSLLPTARALARDMLSCDRRSLLGIKRLYDQGFATTLGEGLRLEAKESAAHAREVRPGEIADRRRGIQERGRTQSG